MKQKKCRPASQVKCEYKTSSEILAEDDGLDYWYSDEEKSDNESNSKSKDRTGIIT